MSFHEEVKRMQTITSRMIKDIDDFMAIEYSRDELVAIIEKYYPEGEIEFIQGAELIEVLRNFKQLFQYLSDRIDEIDFDKVKKAIVDFEYNNEFNFK